MKLNIIATLALSLVTLPLYAQTPVGPPVDISGDLIQVQPVHKYTGTGPVVWSLPIVTNHIVKTINDFYDGDSVQDYVIGSSYMGGYAGLGPLTFDYSWSPYAAKQQGTITVTPSNSIEFDQAAGDRIPPGTVFKVTVKKHIHADGWGSVSFTGDTGNAGGAGITEDNTVLDISTTSYSYGVVKFGFLGAGKIFLYDVSAMHVAANQINTFNGANGINLSIEYNLSQPVVSP